VNRQIGVKVSKFLVVTGPLPMGHVTQRMRNHAKAIFVYMKLLNPCVASGGG